MRSWLGIDIGTSSLKALQIDEGGAVVARSSVEYGVGASAAPDERTLTHAEQDPTVWVRAADAAIAECVAVAGQPSGVGVVGQVPTLVLVDRHGRPTRPAITWQDQRAGDEARELAQSLGAPEGHVGMDLPWSPAQLPAMLRWVARHEPEQREIAHRALQPKDYLGSLLTGNDWSDPWSSKGLCHVRTGDPAETILVACGWPIEICPSTADPWSLRGHTSGGMMGLRAGIPVSVGWSDALASMLAIGAFDTSLAFVLTGTSEIVGISQSGCIEHAPGLYEIPQERAPRSVVYGPTQSSGATVQWLSRLLDLGTPSLLELAAQARRDSMATFVPYINGERAPLWRDDVRAVLAHVDVSDGRPELIRSVLRGVSLSASHILQVAAHGSGHPPDEVHIAGRGVTDPVWQDLWLETLGLPLAIHAEPFVSALGAAMLGFLAQQGSDDFSRLSQLRGEPTRLEPTSDNREFSKRALKRYLRTSTFAQSRAAL